MRGKGSARPDRYWKHEKWRSAGPVTPPLYWLDLVTRPAKSELINLYVGLIPSFVFVNIFVYIKRMNVTSTSDRVLFHLKTRGAATAQNIATAFAMTAMGAHKALQGLLDAGLVQFEDIAGGRGRPKRTYTLSAAGHARFPDRHSDLTVELINHVRTLFGDAGLDRLIAAREAEQLGRYGALVAESLEQKVTHLAEMRAREGYMAKVSRNAAGDLMLIEDHCPICAAAASCQGFCRSELTIFRTILGPDVEITREEHLLSGGRRCAYRIRPRIATPA